MPQTVYRYHDALYLNITNLCPCNCTFCLRQDKPAVGEADSLWLDREPSAAEIITALQSYDLRDFSEVVYCGYGEPFSAYDVMLEVARWLKAQPANPHIRVNTNGLGDLIVGRPTAPELAGLIESLSISLNASTPEAYDELCKSLYGLDALPAVLVFTREAKPYVPEVVLSVVDILPPEQLAACHRIAAELEVPLRIRAYI